MSHEDRSPENMGIISKEGWLRVYMR